jgi:L-asparaginase
MDTFQPRDGAATGRVVDGQLVLAGTPARRVRLPRMPEQAVEDVHLVTAVAGMDGTLLRALRSSHPAGVVVAATGSGNTAADLLAAAQELMSDGTIVAQTTRASHGTVAPIYAFPGGGAMWQRAGALPSVFDGPKTRVALALGLAAELDRAALARLVAGQSPA